MPSSGGAEKQSLKVRTCRVALVAGAVAAMMFTVDKWFTWNRCTAVQSKPRCLVGSFLFYI